MLMRCPNLFHFISPRTVLLRIDMFLSGEVKLAPCKLKIDFLDPIVRHYRDGTQLCGQFGQLLDTVRIIAQNSPVKLLYVVDGSRAHTEHIVQETSEALTHFANEVLPTNVSLEVWYCVGLSLGSLKELSETIASLATTVASQATTIKNVVARLTELELDRVRRRHQVKLNEVGKSL